ncbi:MAG: ammonium transporter [Paludisphaera borealis]|uniref:ammonium transporter n=1 Tax=Paludisphaera borealis TaxID=1387353 RepID=UPI00284E0D85|nr:ammonium transporter [Paludisphaera borealis]MDR3623423.1 ammonium transporter [Paludisphaera borealis]
MKELTACLVWAGGMMALALGATFAHKLGYIDRDTVTRLATGVFGLWMVWYGNRMPKAMVLVRVPASAGQARRVASWSMVLSGLVYAGLWAFAPIPVAATVGSGAVMAGVAVTLGYCLSRRAKPKAV